MKKELFSHPRYLSDEAFDRELEWERREFPQLKSERRKSMMENLSAFIESFPWSWRIAKRKEYLMALPENSRARAELNYLEKGNIDPMTIESARTSDITQYFEGKNKVCCPFHNDTFPSFYMYDDGHYHCFGCGLHGDAIDFAMRYFGLSFSRALHKLSYKL